jgi:hypothetical protein
MKPRNGMKLAIPMLKGPLESPIHSSFRGELPMAFKLAGSQAADDVPFIPSESAAFPHQAAQKFEHSLSDTRGYRDEPDDDASDASPRTSMADRIWRACLRSDLELAGIQLQVERDTVRVTGFVATDAARRRIIDFVGACAGVRVIRNGIRLAR